MTLTLRSPRTSAVVAVASVAVVALSTSVAALLAPAAAADPVSVTYGFTGAPESFTVPTDVTSIHVVAIGGRGSASENFAGGAGGRVEADVPVTAGQTLTVRVGGNGVANDFDGTFNGGGGGQFAGGGASDIRTVAGDLQTRIVTAGGGGGSAFHHAGGQAGADGDEGASTYGGNGATATSPGTGGEGAPPGATGSLGQGGGDQGQSYGGAGGGGVYGGGQATWSQEYNEETGLPYVVGYGGGGGSSGFGPGITGTIGIDATGVPKVTITYTAVTPPPPTETTTTTTTTASPTTSATPTATTTATTPVATSMPTAATTTTPAQAALLALKASRRQQGTAVRATAQVGVSESSVKARLTYKPKAGKAVKVGSLARSHVPAGSLSLKLSLNAKGKTLLKQAGKLNLTLTVTGTPPVGSPVTMTKPVTLKAG